MEEASLPQDPVSATSCAHCEEYVSGWRRAQADYQNLQKETERERSGMIKFANERLVHELTPLIDQLSLAVRYMPEITTLPEIEQPRWEQWFRGLRAVQSNWERVFQSIGVERIPTEGAFDPQLHEAVGEEEVEGGTPGSIIRVMEPGWRLHGKVLQPAKVIITK